MYIESGLLVQVTPCEYEGRVTGEARPVCSKDVLRDGVVGESVPEVIDWWIADDEGCMVYRNGLTNKTGRLRIRRAVNDQSRRTEASDVVRRRVQVEE